MSSSDQQSAPANGATPSRRASLALVVVAVSAASTLVLTSTRATRVAPPADRAARAAMEPVGLAPVIAGRSTSTGAIRAAPGETESKVAPTTRSRTQPARRAERALAYTPAYSLAESRSVATPSVAARSIASTGAIAVSSTSRTPMTWHALLRYPGVSWSASEITDLSTGTGAMANAHALRTHSSLALTIDMDSLIGWNGLRLFVQHKTKTGRNGSGEGEFVQNFSNIDADDFRAFGEAWIEQRVMGDRLRIKVGRLDFNTEFAGTDNGAPFLNASMGYSPSITAAPTFPLPTTGVNAAFNLHEQLTVSAGVFDGLGGAPAQNSGQSQFQIAQANQTWTVGRAALAGRLGVGAWRHTGLFTDVDADDDAALAHPGTRGWYATLDQTLWAGTPRGSDDAERAHIAAFVQVGLADPRVDAVHAHQGLGLVFAGLLPQRLTDLFGVAVTRAAWNDGHESIAELFYQFPVTSHLALVADVQQVSRRAADAEWRRGTVAVMRTIVSF